MVSNWRLAIHRLGSNRRASREGEPGGALNEKVDPVDALLYESTLASIDVNPHSQNSERIISRPTQFAEHSRPLKARLDANLHAPNKFPLPLPLSLPPSHSIMAPRRPDRAPASSRLTSEAAAQITGPTSALTSFLRVSLLPLPLLSRLGLGLMWVGGVRNKVLRDM